MFLDDFAKRFQAAGYNALLYDNRNWFSSDGQPRNETDPALQTRDYLAAFDFAVSQPEVDPTKIVYWGSSMAGGNAICAAAVDHRIRAVISQVPFTNGELVSMILGQKQGFVLHDRTQLAQGGKSMMLPVVPKTPEEAQSGKSQAILNTADLWPFAEALKKRGIDHYSEMTAQTALYLQSHIPEAFVHRVSPTPLLMVVGDQDETIPPSSQFAMYEKALEPKRLHILRGGGHFDAYHGQHFEENIKAQLKFLEEFL